MNQSNVKPVASVVATRIPRYAKEDISVRGDENLLGQRALWSGLAFWAMGYQGYGVELRLTARHDRKIELSLNLLDGDASDAAKQCIVQIERLLPPEYGWVRGSTLFDNHYDEDKDKWRIARVIRRTEFIDLPYHSLLLANAASRSRSDNIASGTGPEVSSQSTARINSHGSLLSLLTSSVGESDGRFLPEPQTHPTELLSRRFCLPLLGALDGSRPRSLRLFEELLYAAPVIVSFCLRPLSLAEVKSTRNMSGNLKRFLAPFASEISNSGFAEFNTLRSIYDRYFLPESYLQRVSIRVAAKSDASAISVATLVGATLGGLRAYRVQPPSRDANLSFLRQDYLDIPNKLLTDLDQQEKLDWRERCQASLEEAMVTFPVDDLLFDFLLRFPHIYSLEETERLIRLPIADDEGLPGFDTRLVPPFSNPTHAGVSHSVESIPADRIRIGIANRHRYGAKEEEQKETVMDGEWHTIDKKDLTKHALVVGSTGSGKTVTTLFLVLELARLNIPFLIIEPVKTEYFGKLDKILKPNLKRKRLEGTEEGKQGEDFLAFDPMRLQDGVSVARHASYLKSCFEAAFPLEPVMAMIFEAGIRDYYTDQSDRGCKLQMFSRGGHQAHRKVRWENGKIIVHPSLSGFRRFFLEAYLPNIIKVAQDQPKLAELRETWLQYFKRRFDSISKGMIGIAARNADMLFIRDENAYNPFSTLLSGPTVLELDGIPDDEHKSLMMAFIMTFLFERRQADDLGLREKNEIPCDDLGHVLIIEEAHRILTNVSHGGRGENAGIGAQAKSVSLFVDMLAEIRAFGQGIIIVEQIPTKIVPEAVKNTNLKIMLRLTAADDREFLGTAMNFTDEQKRFVTSLRAESGRGVDMVVFEQQLDQPRLLTLPLPNTPDSSIHATLFATKS